jgi:hypothetical protein
MENNAAYEHNTLRYKSTYDSSNLYFITGGDAAQMVNNVADGFQYTETQIGTASDFKAWIKDYMNAVVLKLRYAYS